MILNTCEKCCVVVTLLAQIQLSGTFVTISLDNTHSLNKKLNKAKVKTEKPLRVRYAAETRSSIFLIIIAVVDYGYHDILRCSNGSHFIIPLLKSTQGAFHEKREVLCRLQTFFPCFCLQHIVLLANFNSRKTNQSKTANKNLFPFYSKHALWETFH